MALDDDTNYSSLQILWLRSLDSFVTLIGALLTFLALFTTPFGEECHHWRTLPIYSSKLVWEKATFLILLIILPLIAFFTLPLAFFIPSWVFVQQSSLLVTAFSFYLISWVALLCGISPRPVVVLFWAFGAIVTFIAIQTGLGLLLNPGPPRLRISESPLRPLLLSSALLLIAWIATARYRKPKFATYLAVLALMVYSTSGLLWNFRYFKPREPNEIAPQKLDLRVLAENEQPSPEEVRIAPQFAAKVPFGQMLMPYRVDCSTDGSRISKSIKNRLQLSPQLARILPAQLNTDHLIADDCILPSEWTNQIPVPIDLKGSYLGILIKPELVATLPLQRQVTRLIDDSTRLKVISIDEDEGNLRLHLSGLLTSLERHQYDEFPDSNSLSITQNPLGLLLKDSATGTLYQCPYQFVGMNHSSSPIRKAKFSCTLSEEDLRSLQAQYPSQNLFSQLELLVFTYQQVGSVQGNFARENWRPFGTSPEKPQETDNDEKIRWSIAELPQQASQSEVADYLDSILYDLPDRPDKSELFLAKQKYAAVGEEHLASLINHLPVFPPAQQLAHQTVKRHANETHLPALLTALQRDPSLANLFSEKGWSQEAAPVLTELIRNRVPIPDDSIAEVIVIVASQEDPATYPDLAWLFTQAGYKHAELAKVLEELPGFPLAETIEQAWLVHLHARKANPEELGYLAAKQGNREALRRLITSVVLEESASHSGRYKWLEKVIDENYGEDLADWSHQNFERLQFDSQRQRFVLP
ncbi:hypothetical protein [Roseibacillus persicicus]|uniref:Uncharacterized protein n=1 Tax=Roseibacillus persicicus TaxID=454148 RepID=A0A918TGP8_9BACT|nr:hypothetical protein [Roseibacillus persicicus]GHC46022.1 hypothetical protein GCM10007100_09390 [Roseibacillus persicicus]